MASFPRRSRSSVWQYFERGIEKHKCKLCQKTYTRQSGTSNLFAHLKSAHPKEFSATQSSESTGSAATESESSAGPVSRSTGTIRSFFSSSATTASRPCSPARAGELTELLLDWIVDSCRPLSTIADSGLVRAISFMEPGYSVPCRTHIASLLKKRHAD
eukprot:scpid97872/ scgid12521/ 